MFFFFIYSSNELVDSSLFTCRLLIRQSLEHHIKYKKIEEPLKILIILKTPPLQFSKTTGTAFNVFFLISLGIWTESSNFLHLVSIAALFTVYIIASSRKLYHINVSSKKCYIILYTYALNKVCFWSHQMDIAAQVRLKIIARISFPGSTFNHLKTITTYPQQQMGQGIQEWTK